MVRAASFRYITDALTKEEALAMLKEKEAGKKEREEHVKKVGYPAYTTSVGWLGELFILSRAFMSMLAFSFFQICGLMADFHS